MDLVAFYHHQQPLSDLIQKVKNVLCNRLHLDANAIVDLRDKLKFVFHQLRIDLLFVPLKIKVEQISDRSLFEPDLAGEREQLVALLHNRDDSLQSPSKYEFVKSSVAYVLEKTQSQVYRDIIRLVKFWGASIVRDQSFKSKSMILELIAIHSCDNVLKTMKKKAPSRGQT